MMSSAKVWRIASARVVAFASDVCADTRDTLSLRRLRARGGRNQGRVGLREAIRKHVDLRYHLLLPADCEIDEHGHDRAHRQRARHNLIDIPSGNPVGGTTMLLPGYGLSRRLATTSATRLSAARGTAINSRSNGSRMAAGHSTISAAAAARQREVSGKRASYPLITPMRPNGVSNTV